MRTPTPAITSSVILGLGVSPMRRREFIALLSSSAVAWPLAARAQQAERMRRVGVLISSTEDDPQVRRQTAAFQQGLLELGWMEGQNVRIDFRFLGDDPSRIKTYAAELVALKPDALLAFWSDSIGGTPARGQHHSHHLCAG